MPGLVSSAPSSKKLSHSLRAEVFSQWLVKAFGGAGALAEGSGVLDVAGGRGAVAFELSCVRGIPCTVVDPRPIKWNRRQGSRGTEARGNRENIR